MSGIADNTDSITALSSSIHLNEDDWLQFLQKLTPSSIENLQQTLKRLQQRESNSQSDKLSFLATASQLHGSSMDPSIADQNVLTNQTTPIVMSLGVSKATVPSVITVPPVLNVAKSVSNAMSNTIVLPSSAVLITPSTHGQTFSLDSRAGMNRLFLTSEDLVHTSSGSTGSNVPSSSTEAFSSLNTLATAAVAVAASSSNQTPWPSDPGYSSKETTSTDVVTGYPQVLDQSPPQSSTSIPASTSCTISTTADGFFSSFCSAPRHDLSSQLLPSLSAAGITVYPVQVSANGPTVLVAAAPSSTVAAAAAKGLLARNNPVSTPTSPLYTSLAVNMGSSSPTCCSMSNTVGGAISTVTSTTTYPYLLPTSFATTLLHSVPSPATLAPTSLLPSSTPPRTKPKFKALWESNLTGNTADSTSVVNPLPSADSPDTPNVESNVSSSTSSTGLIVTPSSVSGSNRSLSSDNSVSKRQSPLLVGFKSIGQTPKRMAASAATQSDEEYKLSSHGDGSKKLLLVCSQSMFNREVNSVVDTTIPGFAVETAKVTPQSGRTVPADSDQSELVFLTNPHVSLVGGGSDRLITVRPDSKSPVYIQPQPQQPPALFVRNRGATVLLVNHNSNGTSAPATTNNQTNSEQLLQHQVTSANNTVSSETEIVSTTPSTNAHGMDGHGANRIFLDVCKRIMRDDEDEVGDDEARRRAKRRERNRVAAAKCRQRRQDQIIELQHHVVLLTKTGQELRSSIQSLDEESSRLKELIRQHGLTGCPAADDILAACVTLNEPLPIKDNHSSIMDIGEDEDEDELSLDPSAGAIENADDVVMTISTSASAIVAPYSNSGPTTSCSSPTSPISRTVTTKPDPELSDGMSRATSKHTHQQRLLRTSAPANGGSMPTIKQDPFDTATAERSPITDSGSDVSESRHIRTSLRSSCHSPPTTKTRLSAARPCTLLPLKRSFEPVSTSSTAISNTTTKTSTATTPVETTTISSNATNAPDTPVIPCFWPSELHNFSPILTPSAWKVLLKDWGPGTSVCTTTPAVNLTTISSSSSSTNPNPSAAAAAAAALFLTSPTLSSSLTSPCATTNLLVNSLMNSIQNAAAAVAAAGGATVLTTPSTTNVNNVSVSGNSICNNSIDTTTPLLSLAEAISAATENNSQSTFVLSPEQQPQQYTGEELNATTQ